MSFNDMSVDVLYRKVDGDVKIPECMKADTCVYARGDMYVKKLCFLFFVPAGVRHEP